MDGLDLSTLTLRSGPHASRSASALCALEAVAWLAGEPHSDSPECACPVIAAFVREMNDAIGDDAERTRLLVPLLPRIVGSRASREIELRRAYLAADFSVRVGVPIALDAVGQHECATTLRALPEIADAATARAALAVTRAADAYYAEYAAADAYYAATAATAATYAATAAAAFASTAASAAYAATAAASSAYEDAADSAAEAYSTADATAAASAAAARLAIHEAAVRCVERLLDVVE
jgi:hypothetical protein